MFVMHWLPSLILRLRKIRKSRNRETMISCIILQAYFWVSELLVYVRNALAAIFDFMTEED